MRVITDACVMAAMSRSPPRRQCGTDRLAQLAVGRQTPPIADEVSTRQRSKTSGYSSQRDGVQAAVTPTVFAIPRRERGRHAPACRPVSTPWGRETHWWSGGSTDWGGR